MADHFVPGTCNTICDVTGFKVKRSECLVRWDGYVVIPEAWHPRQPQDFPPQIIPQTVVPDARPMAPDEPVPQVDRSAVIHFYDGAALQFYDGPAIQYYGGETWPII